MKLDLSQRVALVTGASFGIGRATAIELARAGARVFVGDFQVNELNRGLFSELGIVPSLIDVRDEATIRKWLDEVHSQVEGIDILVNNAGIVHVGQIPDTTEAEWDACLDTNLKGAFLVSKQVIPSMRKRGGGAIVNVSSNAGLLPRAHDPVYSTSKGALLAFTRSLALSHSVDRIRVNAVCPGPVQATEIIDQALKAAPDRQQLTRQLIDASPLARAWNRMITPEEVAQSILYLVSDAARMVTGTAIAIDGGKSLGVPPVPNHPAAIASLQ